MAKKLPSGEDIAGRVGAPSQTPGISVGKIDYSPMEQGAKALATGLQSVSNMAQRYAEKEQEADDFQTQERFVNFKLDQQAKLEDARRNMPVGGGDFAASWEKSYAADARDFMKSVPQHLRQKYDLGLVEYNARLTGAARTEQNRAADEYETSRLETTLGRLAGAAESDADRGTEFTTQGVGLIEASRLSPQAKAALRDKFEETATFSRAQGLYKAGRKDEAAAVIRELDQRRPQVPVTSVNPSERGKEALQFFMSKGWTREQAAGIVGGLRAESDFNTSARNAGDGADGSDSIGIAQWNAGRAKALQRFAARAGTDWRDFGTQLAFVQHELETTEGTAADRLRGARDVRGAAEAFLHFERPKGYEGGLGSAHGGQKRLSAATAYASLGNDQTPIPPRRPALETDGSPAADGTIAATAATPTQVAQAPASGASASSTMPTGLAGLKFKQFAEKWDKEQSSTTGEAYERSIIDAAAGRGEMPTRHAIEADARLTEPIRNTLLRQFDAQAQIGRARAMDQTQYDASKGLYTIEEADRDWKAGRFKSFEEYNGVVSIAKKFQEEEGSAQRVIAKIADGQVLNPRDPKDRKGLEAIDKALGTNVGLQKLDPTAQASAILNFGKTGMVGETQRGVLEGMIRSGTPQQLEFAMQTLDQAYRRNAGAFVDAFGSDTYNTLQAWQSRVDRNPAVFREWLKQAQDPAHQKAREFLEKDAEKLLKDQTEKDVVSRISPGTFFNSDAPVTTPDYPGAGIMRQEYRNAFIEGYARNGGDEKSAHRYATDVLKQSWGDSKLGGGRLMKYTPEANLPQIGDGFGWAQKQLDEAIGKVAKTGAETPTPLWAASRTRPSDRQRRVLSGAGLAMHLSPPIRRGPTSTR